MQNNKKTFFLHFTIFAQTISRNSSYFNDYYLIKVILPQFEIVPIPKIKNPNVVKGFSFLRKNKNNSQNQLKALECFHIAANQGDVEGQYLFAILSHWKQKNFSNTAMNKISQQTIKYLERSLNRGHLESLVFHFKLNHGTFQIFEYFSRLGNVESKFWFSFSNPRYQFSILQEIIEFTHDFYWVSLSLIICNCKSQDFYDLIYQSIFNKFSAYEGIPRLSPVETRFLKDKHLVYFESDYSLVCPSDYWC